MHRFADLLRVLPTFAMLRADKSVYAHAASRVKDERLRFALSFHPLFIGGDPFHVTSMYILVSHLEKEFGVHYAMGGTGALTFATLHPELIDGVVSLNGTANLVDYDQFQEAIATSFGGTKSVKPEEYRKRSAELNASQLTMPIACTTGGLDKLVPPESVVRLVAQLQKQNRPTHLIHRPQGGHDTTYADATEAFEWVVSRLAIRKPPSVK